MSTVGPTPPDFPVEPVFGIVESVNQMSDAANDALRRRDKIAQEIGKTAIQGTTQVEPNPWA